jgi:hypothetical protein
MNLEDTYSLVVESRQNIDLSSRGLKTLVGKNIPDRVEGFFDCSDNNLTSLEGAPRYVRSGFTCSFNNKLTSLKGAPEYIGSDFLCFGNNLTSLEGLPEYIGGGVYCDDYLMEEENTYIIISSQIRGCYQKRMSIYVIDVMLHRIEELFSK